MKQIVDAVGSPPENWVKSIKNLRNWEYEPKENILEEIFERYDERLVDLLSKMLKVDPSKRINT